VRLHPSSGWLGWPLAICALLSLVVGCAGGSPEPALAGSVPLSGWAEGPASWLLLPAERRELRRVSSSVDSIYFIEAFWQRRDPDTNVDGNPVRETFHRRVDAADQLYPEPGSRGSLTDRGGALILLGSPSHLHVTSRPALSWDPRERSGQRVTKESQSYEIWGYRLEELPPELVELVRRRRGDEPVRLQLTFVRGKERTHLVEGGDLLELAARVLVVDRPDR
jgi:GWxTD domain-containing protein